MGHYTYLHSANDDFGALGQSAPANTSVAAVQRALRLLWERTGNDDYFPGPADGLYGRGTHAAILRASRDFLESEGIVPAQYRSTCNTLWTRVKSVCSDDLRAILTGLCGKIEELTLDHEQINGITQAYEQFLDAYVAEYGDGGELDPAQIARREEVSLETAERLAAERRGPVTETVASGTPDMQVRQAGFTGWLLVFLALGIGGAAAKMAYDNRKQRKLLPATRRY